MPDLEQFLIFGPNIAMLIILVVGALKFAPYWKEVKMREFDVREKEAASRTKQAESLTDISQVIEKVAVSQERTTETNEELRIFLRAAMREHEGFSQRLTTIEEKVAPERKRT